MVRYLINLWLVAIFAAYSPIYASTSTVAIFHEQVGEVVLVVGGKAVSTPCLIPGSEMDRSGFVLQVVNKLQSR